MRRSWILIVAFAGQLGLPAAFADDETPAATEDSSSALTRIAEGSSALTRIAEGSSALTRDAEDLSARLEEARQRLDEAAREVAELTSEQVKSSVTATRVNRAALGIVLAPGNGKGLVVAGVTPGGGAGKAGLKPGDVIVSINGVAVEQPEGHRALPKMLHLLGDVEPGESVRVEYERDGTRATADVVTQEHPAFAMGAVAGMAEPPTIEFFDGPAPPPDALTPAAPMFFTKRLHGGLELRDLDEKLGHYFGVTEGVLVLSAPESEQGLEAGDVVKSIGGEAVATARDCYRALMAAKEDMAVEVLRDGATATVQVKPIEGANWFFPRAGARVRDMRVIRNVVDDDPDGDVNVDVILHEE
jgi:C-terminal processing protease CtpA/Prc